MSKRKGTFKAIMGWISDKHLPIYISLLVLIVLVTFLFWIKVIGTTPFIITLLLSITLLCLNSLIKTLFEAFKSFKTLLEAKDLTLGKIFGNYIVFVVSIIFFFAVIYSIAHLLMGWGYLTYNSCSENFDLKNSLSTDNSLTYSYNTIYFSSITFFTVGYGDICPMGLSKLISIFNALIGAVFNVIVIGISIAKYIYHLYHLNK
jgi:voltage-gated potassium channel Kch